MADIFLSYSREDRAAIEPLAEQIVAAGYSVWWDRQLTGGKRYLEETEAELNAAKVVLVAWSKTSIASHWVADEAGAGRDTGRLLPISLDGSMPPLGFRQFQVIDFSKWTRDDGAALKQLTDALGKLTMPSGEAGTAPKIRPVQNPLLKRPAVLGGLAAAGVAVIAAVAMFAMGPQASQPTAAPTSQRIAFFGFSAAGNDPVLSGIADTATNELFQGMNAQQADMAARADTLGPQTKNRLDRSAELGARFALSGDVRPEAGSGRVSVSIRLEDAATRTTLWEDTFADDTSAPLAVAVRAASRAGDTALCLIRRYPDLARSSADKDLLVTLATYCAGFRGAQTPEATRAIRRLAQLAPKDGETQARLALNLLLGLDGATPSARDVLLAEAEQALERAAALAPESFTVTWAHYRLGLVRGRPLAELETIVKTSLQRAPEADRDAYASHTLVNANYGGLLRQVGRSQAALPYHRTATEDDPFSANRRREYAYALASAGRPEAADMLAQVYARWPSPDAAASLLGSAVLFGAGDADQLLTSPPKSVASPVIQCWRDIHKAAKSDNQKTRAAGGTRTTACLKAGSLDAGLAVVALSMLGDVDGAFAVADNPSFSPFTPNTTGSTVFFVSPTHAMRADPRFLPLMRETGIYQYWLDTGTQPDMCETPEEREFEVCVALRKDQGK